MFHEVKTRKKKKHGWIATLILILIFLVGFSVMLYPTVSNYINTKHQSYAIAKYDEAMNNLSEEDYSEIFEAAKDYNRRLKETGSPLSNYKDVAGYEDVLDITGTGIMGYVTIPQIQIQLPIYHGTSAEVLNIAIGHLEGSTLPIGGDSTHAVLSAHRGLPSAKLFSDLDKLVVGDVFTLTVLNEVLTYEVDRIVIVEPQEVNNLEITSGKDYVTLLTCTPYGVNTHRLLVRGKRIATAAPELVVRVSSDAVQIEPMVVASVIAVPLLIITFSLTIIGGSIRQKHKKKKKGLADNFDAKAGEDSGTQ